LGEGVDGDPVNPVKFVWIAADTVGMKISEEQVRKAVEYLQTPRSSSLAHHAPGVSPELFERAMSVINATPDVRDDRVDSALELLDGSGPSSDEVAQKMIGRIISDSIR
jgi:hypothetical protein